MFLNQSIIITKLIKQSKNFYIILKKVTLKYAAVTVTLNFNAVAYADIRYPL